MAQPKGYAAFILFPHLKMIPLFHFHDSSLDPPFGCHPVHIHEEKPFHTAPGNPFD